MSAARPWLYLGGVSTGDMCDALCVLAGDDANGLQPNVVVRLKAQWAEASDQYQWNKRDLKHAGWVYWWAAREEVFPQTRQQRCWFHKIGNLLNALLKAQLGRVKTEPAHIWNAVTCAEALVAFERFVATYGAKYPKAVEKLTKERNDLLAFYDFPAEHWQRLRATNPIESAFATVRHRTSRARYCLSRATFLGMAFKLVESAEQSWRRIRGAERIEQLLKGIPFEDGIPVIESAPAQQPFAA
ncbi:hypothetical protein WJ64_20540 [Burkholderia ubonensis]|nr:hypothetical protein WJ64_20540 [Burkholderia ubonensis]